MEKSLPLALEMLTSDHRKVEDLFTRFEEMKEANDASRVAIAQSVCSALTLHMQIEEDLLYPWLRENMDDTGMLAEAYIEHATAKQLITGIMQVGEPDEEYDAKVKVLSEYIKHHVKEEEREIFPSVAGEEEELDELGQEMFARKCELMAEMRMEEQMPASGALADRPARTASGAPAARGRA